MEASLPRGDSWVRAPDDTLTRVRFPRLRRQRAENSASNRKGPLGSTLGVCRSCARLLDGNAAGAAWYRAHGLTDEKLRSAQTFAKGAEELVGFVGDAPAPAACPHTNAGGMRIETRQSATRSVAGVLLEKARL